MALWVVLGHVLLSFTPPPSLDGVIWRALCENGKAVDVFIILSGFVIFHLLWHSRESHSRYIARRFLRLFPAYLVCLLVSAALLPVTDVAIHSVHPFTQRTLDRTAILQAGMARFWPHLLTHLTMLHGAVPASLLPLTDYVFLGQAWSISVEWQFYLLAPLLMWLATLRPRLAGLTVLALLCAGLFHARLGFGEGFIGAHIGYFALGCASFFFWQADRRALAALARHTPLVILTASAAWLLLLPQAWPGPIWLMVLLSCNSMRFPKPGPLERAVSTALLTPALRWLGRISYPVYLVHMIILNVTLWLLSNSGMAPLPLVSATLLGTLIGTLISADLLHRLIEIPSIAFGRRLPTRWFPMVPQRGALQRNSR